MNTQTQTNSFVAHFTPDRRSREVWRDSDTRGLELRYAWDAEFPGSPSSSPQIRLVAYSEEIIEVEITTFRPEPYNVKHPINVRIRGEGSEYIASHFESNIHASGDNDIEAFDNLKSLILDIFESLTAEPEENLGRKPLCQLAVLRELIERA